MYSNQAVFFPRDLGFAAAVFERGFAAAALTTFVVAALVVVLFFAGVTFFVAAALAFVVAVVPVTAFFAVPRLTALVVFFVVAFAFGLPANVFFVVAAFFAGAAAALVATALEAVAFLVGTGAGLAFVFETGFEFSLAPPALFTLGASLTLPEGPFGREKNTGLSTTSNGSVELV